MLYSPTESHAQRDLEAFNLAIMNLDLAIREKAPSKPTAESSAEEKAYHERWEHSNRTCLMIMKYTMDKSIKQCVPDNENAMAYLADIGKQFTKFDKTQKATYMQLLTSTKYDGFSGVREHIMKLTHYFNKLKDVKVKLAEDFLRKREHFDKPESALIVTNGGGSHKKKNLKPEKPIKQTGPTCQVGPKGDVFKGKCNFCLVYGHKRMDLPLVPLPVIVSPPVEQQVTPLQEPNVDVKSIVDEGASNNTLRREERGRRRREAEEEEGEEEEEEEGKEGEKIGENLIQGDKSGHREVPKPYDWRIVKICGEGMDSMGVTSELRLTLTSFKRGDVTVVEYEARFGVLSPYTTDLVDSYVKGFRHLQFDISPKIAMILTTFWERDYANFGRGGYGDGDKMFINIMTDEVESEIAGAVEGVHYRSALGCEVDVE
ncbi:hypothetical protein Vadar_026019 [Vaccinium darrowii]|uniref:Uncharacterized protein n=1 Tax=Vaccinium darrowii TaxID=229202 RepID=A0ACB7X4J1_9ERIC|nr:hypothetical protein Vadar_026019 [Vaccinium darrowii]